jgi:hypothetical protein
MQSIEEIPDPSFALIRIVCQRYPLAVASRGEARLQEIPEKNTTLISCSGPSCRPSINFGGEGRNIPIGHQLVSMHLELHPIA